MTKLRLYGAVDHVAHFLHTPTMRGSRSARTRWHHRIHLVPYWLIRPICDRYEHWLEDVR